MAEEESVPQVDQPELGELVAPDRYIAFARAGDVVFLESTVQWGDVQREKIADAISAALANTGVRAVLLPVGVRVARVELEGS